MERNTTGIHHREAVRGRLARAWAEDDGLMVVPAKVAQQFLERADHAVRLRQEGHGDDGKAQGPAGGHALATRWSKFLDILLAAESVPCVNAPRRALRPCQRSTGSRPHRDAPAQVRRRKEAAAPMVLPIHRQQGHGAMGSPRTATQPTKMVRGQSTAASRTPRHGVLRRRTGTGGSGFDTHPQAPRSGGQPAGDHECLAALLRHVAPPILNGTRCFPDLARERLLDETVADIAHGHESARRVRIVLDLPA